MSSFVHSFSLPADGMQPPSLFTYPFHYTPHPLTLMAAKQTQEYLTTRTEWHEELQNGKMFGVLVVLSQGQLGFLAAFSGNLAGSNLHDYFVPPVYDLLQPDGFFRREESEISAINQRIRLLEADSEYIHLQSIVSKTTHENERMLAQMRFHIKIAKMKRDAERMKSSTTAERMQELIRESQFQKAEYQRLKHMLNEKTSQEQKQLQKFKLRIEQLKQERRTRSAALQEKLFRQFQMLNAYGEKKDLYEIFQHTRRGLPPAGTGECALPKLLQYAYQHKLTPLAMGEFWWGKSPKDIVRRHGDFYPSCRQKCEPILQHMLQGLHVEPNPLTVDEHKNTPLRIIYEDQWLVAVDKPAGMLSVPGKNGLESVCDRLREMYPDNDSPLLVHRLDMATSGILIAAKNLQVYRKMQTLFTSHLIHKCYIALLEGIVSQDTGTISLPLSPDPYNRPFQKVDPQHGKEAITYFKVIERRMQTNCTLVKFYPETGRTHQLRLHASHPHGLGHPIVGDSLYGHPGSRLFLHASEVSFTHPVSGIPVRICAPAEM